MCTGQNGKNTVDRVWSYRLIYECYF